MKKLLIGLAAALLCLSGCGSSSKETKTICQANVNGMNDVMTITASDDRVTLLNEVIELAWADFEVETEEDKALFEEMLMEEFSVMEEYDGITIASEAGEDALKIKIDIDVTKVDYDVLVDLGMAEATSEKVAYISLEDSISGLESGGYSCSAQ